MCIAVLHPILRALYGLFTGGATSSSSSAVRVTVSHLLPDGRERVDFYEPTAAAAVVIISRRHARVKTHTPGVGT